MMSAPESSLSARSSTIFVSLAIAGSLTQLISIIVARMLEVTDFGVYSILISIQGALGVAAAFGMRITLAKFVAEYKHEDAAVAMRFAKTGVVLTISVSFAVVLIYLALAGVISNDLYDEPGLIDLIPFSGLVIFVAAVHTVTFGVAQGCQRTRVMVFMQILPPLITLFLVLVLIPTMGVVGVLLALFISKAITASLSLLHVNRAGFPFLRTPVLPVNRDILKKILNFSIPAVMSSSVVMPVLWLGNTKLTVMEGFEAMGLFAVALFFFNAIQIIPQSIAIPFVPKVSESYRYSSDWTQKTSIFLVRLAAVVLFPIIIFAATFDREIIALVFGASYSDSAAVTHLILYAAYFAALASIVGAMIAGIGRMWMGFGSNAVWACSYITLVFAFVPSLGLEGMGLAFLGSYGIHLGSYFLISKRVCGVNFSKTYVLCILPFVWLFLEYLMRIGHMDFGFPGRFAIFMAGTSSMMILGRDIVKYLLQRFVRTF